MTASAAAVAKRVSGNQTERPSAWSWPVDLLRYDQSSKLTAAERAALELLGDEATGWWFRPRTADAPTRAAWRTLDRLLLPLRAARDGLDLPNQSHHIGATFAVGILLRQCGLEGRSFWGWPQATWIRVLGTSGRAFVVHHDH